MKSGYKRTIVIKRIIAFVLAVFLCIPVTPFNAHAMTDSVSTMNVDSTQNTIINDNNDIETYAATGFTILLNGNSTVFAKKLKIPYGDALSLTLDGYSPNWYTENGSNPSYYVSPQYGYTKGDLTGPDESGWREWNTTDMPVDRGVYYLYYEFTDNGGTTFSDEETIYGFEIVAAELAKPTGLSWNNGSIASWTAVTKNSTTGTTLKSGALSGYEVTLYKDNVAVGTPVITTTPSYDFKSAMLSNGIGRYTFTVKAIASDEEPFADNYTDSQVSSKSAAKPVVSVSVVAGTGISSTTPSTSTLLIPGCSGYKSISISASVETGNSFDRWDVVPNGALTINNNITNTEAAVADSYSGELEITLTAYGEDITAPQINSYTAGTGERYGTIIGNAIDNETGISEYVFSTAESADGITEQWVNESTPVAGETEVYSYTVTSAGKYYLYVKDANGHITRSSNYIQVTQIKYNNYYSDNSLKDHSELLVGTESVSLASTSRGGYTFGGWYRDDIYSSEAITALSAVTAGDGSITLYGKWDREEITFQQQPADITMQYDGQVHNLSVKLSNESYGDIAYQWYRDNAIIDGATSATYSVKNVADSATYHVVASVTIDGVTKTATSNTAEVNITKAPLTMTATSTEIVYGSDIPTYEYVCEGLLGDDIAATSIREGSITCSYVKGSDAGRYDIELSGYSSANYNITSNKGVLTVNAKNVNDDNSGVTLSLVEGTYVYTGSNVTPDVLVKDGDNTVDSSDYTVTYSNNVNAGDAAEIIVTFRGNYTGELEKTFAIEKADFAASVNMSGWTYGETAKYPSLSNNGSGGDEVYLYYKKGEGEGTAIATKPSNAGDYYVYCVILGTDNYNRVTTEPVEFTIAKRNIVITAASALWIYDGNEHFAQNYTVDGTFAGTDSFLSVTVSGSVRDVGEQGNNISYVLSSSTNPDNYNIVCEPGTLTVTAKGLTAPSNNTWDATNPGKASWIAVSRSELEVGYELTLYREIAGSEDTIVGEVISTTETSYDFTSIIKNDSIAGYYYTVKAIPVGGANKSNYLASDESSRSSSIYTVKIKVVTNNGIEAATINGGNSAILLQGETASISAQLEPGYSFNEPVWSTNSSIITFANAIRENTSVTVSSSITKPYEINIMASSVDDRPVITSYTATADDTNREVTLNIAAADTKSVNAWAITSTANAPSEDSFVWQNIAGENASINITKNVYISGVYYAWIKDDAGNIEGYEKPINIYDINFTDNIGKGSMDSILKIENVNVKLPANTFIYEGFVFVNWKGSSGIYADQGNYAANSSDTLIAQWTNQEIAYKVNYYYMDKDGNYATTPASTKSFTGTFGSSVSSDNSKIQNSQAGMSLDTTKIETVELRDADKELNVYYKRNIYTITYTYTSQEKSEEVSISDEYLYGAAVTEREKPVEEGFNFVGWVYGESGTTPETMPNKNITATGTFIANPATYEINYYVQGIGSDTYTIRTDMTEIKDAMHRDKITASIDNADRIEGFTIAGITVSKSSVNGSSPSASDLNSTVVGTVSVKEGEKLHINYYYTRNTYSITLNVWKGNRDITNKMYTYTEEGIPYGADIDAEYYEIYGKSEWTSEIFADGYRLADYADWSTGTSPTTMPAGDITVSRDYIETTMSSYIVEIYEESTTEGEYTKSAALTFYASEGQNISIVENVTDSTSQVSIDSLKKCIYYGDIYSFNSDHNNNVLTGTVTNPDSGEETLVLRAYFDRKETTITINYYYYPKASDTTDANNTPVKIGKVTKTGKWGTVCEFEPTLAFEGSVSDSTWEGEDQYIEEVKADQYNYKTNRYVISYSGSYMLNGNRRYVSNNLSTVASLTDTYSVYYGTDDKGEINVFYSIASMKENEHYYLDLVYDNSYLAKSDNSTKPVTVEINDVEYRVRIANKADIFYSEYVVVENADYPGISTTSNTYKYENLTGERSGVREGFTEIEYNGNTYYATNIGGINYIYVADERNRFYYGNYASYGVSDSVIGYSSVVDFLEEYKETQKGLMESGTSEYDEKYDSAYIYNTGYSGIMSGNASCKYEFRYSSQYTLTCYLAGEAVRTDLYTERKQIDISSIVTNREKDGYTICWYTDGNYENKAENFAITQNTNIYGRYERNIIYYHEYMYYQLPDAITIDGKETEYITVDNIDRVKELYPNLIKGEKHETKYKFEDEFNVISEKNITSIVYRIDGVLCMIDVVKPCSTFTEVSIDYSAADSSNPSASTGCMVEGFYYDATAIDNMVKGYCQTTPTNLSVYCAREKYTLTIDRQNADITIPESKAYRYSQTITIEAPIRNGYTFKEWSWEKYEGEDASGNAIWSTWDKTTVSSEKSDGSVVLRMPNERIRMTANWEMATYNKEITHYFSDITNTYDTEFMAQIRKAEHTVSAKVNQNGQEQDAIIYYASKADANILGVSVEVGAYTYYYSEFETIKGVKYVDTLNLIAATSLIENKTTGDDITVSNYKFNNENYDMFEFAFVVVKSNKEVKTLQGNETYIYDYDSVVDYYYRRTGGYTLREAAKPSDAVVGNDSTDAAGVTIIGAGEYSYGAEIEMRASVSQGYMFLGWYKAEDVIDGYNIVSTDLDTCKLKTDWEKATPVSELQSYTIKITKNTDYIAITRPLEVDIPEITIEGNNEYEYGYTVTSANELTAVVTFDNGASSASAVSEYQWYEDGELIAAANASKYTIPVGKDCGSYHYNCEVTVVRTDNGRSATVKAEEDYEISVTETGMTVKVTEYSGVYDGKAHGIDIDVESPEGSDDFAIYYSQEELTEDNYEIDGTTVRPEFVNVPEDVSRYVIYYYIVDKTGNYLDYSGYGVVAIEPKRLTLASGSIYSKEYDAKSQICGSITESGTQKYELTYGDYYSITGIVDSDTSKGYILDFDAVYNSAHVDNANNITISNMKVADSDGNVNINYCFDEDYEFIIPGYIKPYQLNIKWADKTSFVYDGLVQAPEVELISENMPNENVAIEVVGGQMTAGNYTAFANVEAGAGYETSDYEIKSNSCAYTISKRAITIIPDNKEYTYDKTEKGLDTFEVVGTTDETVALVAGHTYTAKVNDTRINAGEYNFNASDMHIYGDGIEVTDNYDITYGTGVLTINKRQVTFANVIAENKEYDGNTDAVLDISEVVFTGIIDGDSLSLNNAAIEGYFANPDVGNRKTVTLDYTEDVLTGTSVGNYILNANGSQKTTTANITKDVITVTVKSVSTVYGESAPFEVVYSGFEDADDESVISGSVSYTIRKSDTTGAASAYTVTTASGTYDIILNISRLSAANYTFEVGATAKLTVAKRLVAVKSVDTAVITKEYDGNATAYNLVKSSQYEFTEVEGNSISGVVNGDKLSLDSTFKAVFNNKGVIQATHVVVSSLSISNSNYELVTNQFEISGEITKRAVTVTACDKTITYGDAMPSQSEYQCIYDGLVEGESENQFGTLKYTTNYNTASADSRQAGTYNIEVSGHTSDNYEFSHVKGTLYVEKALIKVTAEDKVMDYGNTAMPTYTCVFSNGFKYDESAYDSNVIAGEVTYTCKSEGGDTATLNSPAGEYIIHPITTNLVSANYKFASVDGKLQIDKYVITISGISVSGKEYDGTTVVDSADIDTTAMIYNGVLEKDMETAKNSINVTAKYTDKNAGNNKEIALTITLGEYISARYALSSSSQATTTANITQRQLIITADNKAIKYGDNIPTYTVKYSGFVASEDASELKGSLEYEENENTYEVNDHIGTYRIIPKGYEQETNYKITFVEGILTVSPATLNAPVISWDEDNPGLAKWTAVSGIGNITVAGYKLELYKSGYGLVPVASCEETELYHDFLEEIRKNGAGEYYVCVTALPNNTVRTEAYNVNSSVAAKSASKYAAEVNVQYALDYITQSGKESIHINNGDSYVVVAGESNIELEAVIRNATGYSAKSWTADSSKASVSEINKESNDREITAKVSVESTLNSSADINLTLSLEATAATCTGIINRIGDDVDVFYGYTSEKAPRYKVEPNVGTDNVDSTGYIYTYQWKFYRNRVEGDKIIAGATDDEYTLATGYAAMTGYYVRCTITATRIDNGQSCTYTASRNVIIKKATDYLSEVKINGWKYGEHRNTPYVTYNPEKAQVTYEYKESSAQDTSYTDVIPTDAGTYCVRATIAESENYAEKELLQEEFVIEKTKLDVPEGLKLEASTSSSYGKAVWNEVATPKENAGEVGFASSVEIEYIVKLYYSENEGEEWRILEEYTTEDCEYDMTADIIKPGVYRFTVTATVRDDDDKKNCDNSEESSKRGELDINASVESKEDIHEKIYDSKEVELYVQLDNSSTDLSTTYQWYCNNNKIDGATKSSYNVCYVNQSGNYTCEIKRGEHSFFSTGHILKVLPRRITLEAESETKIYDGRELENDNYEVTTTLKVAEGDTIECEMNARITDVGKVYNEFNDIKIYRGEGELVYAMNPNVGTDTNVNNYIVTTQSGVLEVTRKTLGADLVYADSIEVSCGTTEVTYNSEAYEPTIKVTDKEAYKSSGEKGLELVAGKDYDLIYINNVHAGTAVIVMEGKGNYVDYIAYKFTIKQADITVESESKEQDYNGRTLMSQYSESNSGSIMITQGLKGGDTLKTVVFNNRITNAGSCSNTFNVVLITNNKGEDVTSDYNITKKYGTLTVNKAQDNLIITNDITKEYDGTPVVNPTFKMDGNGDITFKYYTKDENNKYYELTTNPKDAGTYYVKAYETESSNYLAAESDYNEFNIEKRVITITAAEKSSKHGEPMAELTKTVVGEMVVGDDLNITLSTEATSNSSVGDYEISISYTENSNYDVIINEAKYYIYAGDISFEQVNYQGIYDKAGHGITIKPTIQKPCTVYYATEEQLDADRELNEDNYITVGATTVNPQFTDAGVYRVYFYIMAENYVGTSGVGTVTINKSSQRITVESKTYEYDGKFHTLEASCESGGNIEYEYVGAEQDGAIYAGTYQVKITAEETANYNKATTTAELIITRRKITLRSNDNEKEYDTTALTEKSYTIQEGSLVTDGVYAPDEIKNVTYTGSIIDAGTESNTFGNAKISNSKQDVSDCYAITYVPGTLTVHKTDPVITIVTTSETMGKTYDKSSVTDPSYSITGDGECYYRYYKIDGTEKTLLTDKPIDAGDYEVVVCTYEGRNYYPGESEALAFKIKPREITLKGDDAWRYYRQEDGELTASVTNGTICDGDDLDIGGTTDADIESEIGSYNVIPTYTENSNYIVTIEYGVYTIEVAELEYEAADNNVVYSGNSYGIILDVPEGVEIYYSDIPLDEGNYLSDGSLEPIRYTDAGTYTVYYYIHSPNYVDKYGMSEIIIRKATPSITVSGKLESVYDGKVHSISATCSAGLSLRYDRNGWTDVGIYNVRISTEETNNYYSASQSATYIITKREIIFTAASETREYTGEPLAKNEYTVSEDGLAEGDYVESILVEGEQVDPGASDNIISEAVIRNSKDIDVTSNYDIEYVSGRLIVTGDKVEQGTTQDSTEEPTQEDTIPVISDSHETTSSEDITLSTTTAEESEAPVVLLEAETIIRTEETEPSGELYSNQDNSETVRQDDMEETQSMESSLETTEEESDEEEETTQESTTETQSSPPSNGDDTDSDNNGIEDEFVLFNFVATIQILITMLVGIFKKRLKLPMIIISVVAMVMLVLTTDINNVTLFNRYSIVYGGLMAADIFMYLKKASKFFKEIKK